MLNTTTHADMGTSAHTRNTSAQPRSKPTLLQSLGNCVLRTVHAVAVSIQKTAPLLSDMLSRFPRTIGTLVLGSVLLVLLSSVPVIGGALMYIGIILIVVGGIVSLYTDTMDYFNECRLKNSISRTLDSFRNAMNGGDQHANFDGTDNSADVH